jgi:hypothetical protein
VVQLGRGVEGSKTQLTLEVEHWTCSDLGVGWKTVTRGDAGGE